MSAFFDELNKLAGGDAMKALSRVPRKKLKGTAQERFVASRTTSPKSPAARYYADKRKEVARSRTEATKTLVQPATKVASPLELARMAVNSQIAEKVGLKTPGGMMMERIREGTEPEPALTPAKVIPQKKRKQIEEEIAQAIDDVDNEKNAGIIKGAAWRKMAGLCKRTCTIDGLSMKLEYEKGDVRFKGAPHERISKDHYGYMPGTYGKGADGEAIDVYLNPDIEKGDTVGTVFKIRQLKKKTGDYDEDKFMVGYPGATDARKAFLRNMPDWAFGSMVSMSREKFNKLVGQ